MNQTITPTAAAPDDPCPLPPPLPRREAPEQTEPGSCGDGRFAAAARVLALGALRAARASAGAGAGTGAGDPEAGGLRIRGSGPAH
jgi:hypothetical protein